jgi:hypothetical protein
MDESMGVVSPVEEAEGIGMTDEVRALICYKGYDI